MNNSKDDNASESPKGPLILRKWGMRNGNRMLLHHGELAL
ncbi:UNVERIFIED_ORG: hypothetical protein M2393_001431 [Pseudomonas psychrophila]